MAAFFGLAHLSASLLEQQDDTKVEPDSGDFWERTPLLYAAEGGHMAVVKLLLERTDIDVNCKRDIGPIPRICYVREAMAKTLLEHPEMDAEFRDWSELTPLRNAAYRVMSSIVGSTPIADIEPKVET